MPLGAKLSISKYPAFSRFRREAAVEGVGQFFEAAGMPPILESATAYRSRQNWRAVGLTA